MFDFTDLEQQVRERLIVEEAETLAAIALLVPDLLEVVKAGATYGAAAERALIKANAVLKQL
jgi:hypothetical protein